MRRAADSKLQQESPELTDPPPSPPHPAPPHTHTHQRVLYLTMRQHRFFYNFGYGFGADDDGMTSVAMLVTSTFLELAFEFVVDMFALNIEAHHGIVLENFWQMWRTNALAFWGKTVFDSFLAIGVML